MSDQWQEQQERGSECLLHFMSWLSLSVGRPVARLLLIPICAYFLVCSVAARKASHEYLTAILGRRARIRDIFRHYHTFASTILDRVFFLVNRFEDYEISVKGLELIDAQVRANRGFLLLGAHLGSFEVLHTLGAIRTGIPIKALMYPSNSRQVNALRTKLNSKVVADTILLGSPTAMLEAKEHLERGGVVGMLGDRILRRGRSIRSHFLGKPALFPEGPMLLAGLLQVPVLLMFGLYMGNRRYEIHFELFANVITIGRRTRQADIEAWTGKYVARLEHYCHMAPFNWFNFYDFWDTENAET